MDKECHFWTYKPHKSTSRKSSAEKGTFYVYISTIFKLLQQNTIILVPCYILDGSTGGMCIMKNELALCGRRKSKMDNVVSGPKACTPE